MSAAGRLFARSGLSEVTVAQILDQSGVKAPTLYHHFGGKEGLYVSWACHTLDVMSAEFKALSAAGPTLRDFLIEASHILLSPRSMDVLQVLRDRKWLADPESLEQVDDALKAAVFQPIARALSSASPALDPMDASQAFVHLVSVRRPSYKRSDAMDPIPADEVVDLFLSGIQASTRTLHPSALVLDGVPEAPVEVK
jgi:AcrR family transcriptional regulator